MYLASLGQYSSSCSLEPLCNKRVLTTVFCKSTRPPIQESNLASSSMAIIELKNLILSHRILVVFQFPLAD